jgi:hypothetical protein
MDSSYISQKKIFKLECAENLKIGNFFGIQIKTNQEFTPEEKKKILIWCKMCKDNVCQVYECPEKNMICLYYILQTKKNQKIKLPTYFQNEFSNSKFTKFFETEDECESEEEIEETEETDETNNECESKEKETESETENTLQISKKQRINK